MPQSSKLVSLVIPTYNRKDDLVRFLASVNTQDYPLSQLEVVIVDNAANLTDESISTALSEKISYQLLKPDNNLFCSGGREYGAKFAHGELLFFIDDDNIMEPSCIKNLAAHFETDSKLGVATPLTLYYKDKKRIWLAGVKLTNMGMPLYLHNGSYTNAIKLPDTIEDLDSVPNAFMTSQKVLEQVPFDTVNFPHNWSEADFALRLKKNGYKSLVDTKAISWHDIDYDGRLTRVDSVKVYDQARSRIVFRKRFMNKGLDWLAFWGIIFPFSTITYAKGGFKSSDKWTKVMQQYIKGTRDGLATVVSEK